MPDRLRLPLHCRHRMPLVLLEKSCHVLLSSLNFQSSHQQAEAVRGALQALGTAFETSNFSALFECKVGLMRAGEIVSKVTLATANSQLHGLNTDTLAFQFGYEPDIAAILDHVVSDVGTFVDVGANFGYFSLYLASRESYQGTIHAFEPSARGHGDLTELVTGFKFEDKIQIHQCALGDKTGTTELLLSNSDGLTTMVPSMANKLEKVIRTQVAELRRLDDFSFSSVDLIKIDVEGAESMVIAGALDTIQTHLPVVIFESWASTDDHLAWKELSRSGYCFFVPTWQNRVGHMTAAISDAVDATALSLVSFNESERKKLPEQLNIVALHSDQLNHFYDRRNQG